MNTSNDGYVLGRDDFAGIRLNLQHFLMNKVAGYSLHPAINHSKKSGLKVADVGTGTGIWLLDLHDEVDDSAELTGFDIDLAQCPPREWMPPNVKFQHLDITKDLPAELEGQFDVVHLRLFMLVLPTDDAVWPVLRNMIKMLKPGGWIQWHEVDRKIGDISTAREAVSTEAMRDIELRQKALNPKLIPATWPARLGDFFKADGLEMVQADIRKPQVDGKKWLAFSQQTVMAVYSEIGSRLPPGEARDVHASLVPKAAEESRDGAAWNTTRYVWIGRKADK